MSPRLTPIAGKELVRLPQEEGFQVVRVRGATCALNTQTAEPPRCRYTQENSFTRERF